MSPSEAHPWHRTRGQGGIALMAVLVVWVLVGGLGMVALLNMTATSTRIAAAQRESAQQARALDAAMETAVNLIEQDPSGRMSDPDADGSGDCLGRLGRPGDDGVGYDDGLGTWVRVRSECRPTDSGLVEVRLTAHLDDAAAPAGSAVLLVADRQGPGTTVSVRHWSLRGPGREPVPPPPTTAPPTTAPPTTAPPTTAPPTTAPPTTAPGAVTWTERVTSDWGAGYCVEFTVLNSTSATVGWQVDVPVDGSIYTFWNGRYERSGSTLRVVGESWNQELAPDRTTSFGFCSNR
jgi:cellulase/cellobiase CelA1